MPYMCTTDYIYVQLATYKFKRFPIAEVSILPYWFLHA